MFLLKAQLLVEKAKLKKNKDTATSAPAKAPAKKAAPTKSKKTAAKEEAKEDGLDEGQESDKENGDSSEGITNVEACQRKGGKKAKALGNLIIKPPS